MDAKTTHQLDRTFDSRLVAWCPDCRLWLPSDYIGLKCLSECEVGCGIRTLVKRRMWICSVRDCAMAFKDLKEANDHDCYSAY